MVAIVAAGAFVTATAAQAAPAPWWHLNSGSRPSNLYRRPSPPEVQELTVKATGGPVVIVELRKSQKEDILTGKLSSNLHRISTNATAAEPSCAEEIYGSGNVEVGGGPGDPDRLEPLHRHFLPAPLADQPLELMNSHPLGLGLEGEGDCERGYCWSLRRYRPPYRHQPW